MPAINTYGQSLSRAWAYLQEDFEMVSFSS